MFVNGYYYYYKIWDNNVLVRHFVPAKRDSDNVVGFYELVSKTFYAPVTGTFTAGPEASNYDITTTKKSLYYVGD